VVHNVGEKKKEN